ncbi:hypothetical protein [Nocardiopsis sp. HUAS JQ3]|uniref:hypothetical protein n=1 Tax=Nocardiopsis sp. HUAS JQ3 TaxID=3061629 RepID=UPI0023A9F7D5|nr:hypothetical protein [Nocardiopsis sp. HUAS JQ3]WDZ89211.1 hypothetical protein PV789_19955 [Nocardiopsis sp. HUAS JQ3]
MAAAVVEGAPVSAGTVLYAWRTLRVQPDRVRARHHSAVGGLLLVGSFVSDLLAS